MTDNEKLQQLQTELQPYQALLCQAADTILEQDVSNFPIFVIHQHTVDIGIPMVQGGKGAGNWSVNASSLEEFVAKQIVRPDRVENFKEVYKDPATHLCLFVLSELGAKFVFIKRNPPLSKSPA
ncbi:MAG: hypothetical protein D6714_13020 [Bacteroidetes bacterium]|nr:MAG: hypothetical protein D6714_13020 [Bacteroidota bacterium]